jgi:hypothetical protein
MANTLRFKRGLASGIPTALAGEPLFTTDTFDLYIGNGTTNTRFQKYIASGTTSQLLRGDGSLLTMPIVLTSPATGQVLKYNGTSWVNDSDAGITGSGAAGQVAYFTGATTQAGSNNLFWDATNLRLGIGTNTPTRALQVQGTGFFADNLQVQRDFIGATTIRVGNSGTIDAATMMQFALSEDGSTVNGYFRRYRNGSALTEIGFSNALAFTGAVTGTAAERMRLDASGDLILGGTSAYGATFTSYGRALRSGGIGIRNSAGTAAGAFSTYAAGSGSGSTDILVDSTGFITFATASTERMKLFGATGNLSIGAVVTDTGEKLQVTGTMKVTGNVQVGSKFGVGTTTTAFAYINGANAVNAIQVSANGRAAINFEDTSSINQYLNIGVQGSSAYIEAIYSTCPTINYNAATRHVFTTNSSERMRLDASGNLGIGTASPLYKLQVGNLENTSGTTNDIFITGDKVNANGYYARLIFGNSTQSGGSTASIRGERSNGSNFATSLTFYTNEVGSGGNGVENMRLDANGNLLLGNTTGTSRLDVAKFASDTLSRANSAMAIGDFVFGAGLMLQQRVSAPYGFMVQATNSTAATFYPLLLQPNGGNVVLGGTTDSGEKLQVTGTAKITGNTAIGGTAGAVGTMQIIKTGTSPVSNQLLFGTDGTGYQFAIGKNQGGTITNYLTLQDNGVMRLTGSFVLLGGNALQFVNSAANTVSAIRPTGGGTSVMSTNSNGLHIAVGTEAAGDLILASNNTERVRLSSNGWFSHTSATNPSSSVTDSYVQYSADVTAGNAAPHFRTENGAVIKLYQETTAVGNSIFSQGGGNAVLDDSTFAGYTIRQVVQALRNQGILQ